MDILKKIYLFKHTPYWLRRLLNNSEHAWAQWRYGWTVAELENIPQNDWAEISCTMNSWKIPPQLLHIKPAWWPSDNKPANKYRRMMHFMYPISDYIDKTIGPKAVNRHWNSDMTDAEHELFWSANGRYC